MARDEQRVTPEIIRTLRSLRGWTTEEVATHLGMHGSGSIIADWEEGRRTLEGPIAELVLLTLRREEPTSIGSRAERIWRRSGNWRESWRQVSAVPLEPTNLEASEFARLFPGPEIPPHQYAHGFPFLDHGLPPEVYGLHDKVWRGMIPEQDLPPAYLWLLERDGAFLYREKIWEDDKASITAGHIHVGSLLEICAAVLFFLRRLAEQVSLSSRYQLTLEMNGMKGRGVVAQREFVPSDVFLVDEARHESTEEHRAASLSFDLDTMTASPLGVVYDLVAEALLELRPDLATRTALERQLKLRHAFDSRRGDLRFVGFLDDIFGRPPRRAVVSLKGRRVGLLVETTGGSRFTYDRGYLDRPGARPLSPKLPLRSAPFESSTLLPFFENLLPEGAQLEILVRQRKLDPRDKLGLLLATLPSSVGDVQIHQEEKAELP